MAKAKLPEAELYAPPALPPAESEWGEGWQAPRRERALVALDPQGAVVSPLRRYAGRAAAYGALSILSTIGVCSLAAGDPLVLALSLVGTAAWGHGILVTRWLEQASLLMQRGRLDEAEALLQRCLRPPWGSEGVRAHANLRLAGVLTRRGQHDKAAAIAREAAALFQTEYPPQPQFVRLARYQEIRALVSAGKQPDARILLEEVSDPPVGEYLRLQHYLTELYVALGDGRLPFLEAPLRERVRLAERDPQQAGLLGLCGWGFYKLGELEQARHLLRLSVELQPSAGLAVDEHEPIAQTLPLLHRFLVAHPELLGRRGGTDAG
ncbi:MAG: tetratricopeptide repeat protein [Polyangia bacterium]